MNNSNYTIQIASDLHIDKSNHKYINPLSYITPKADILVLAGDIGSLYKLDQLYNFLKALCKHFKQVFYVPGNHEFYIQKGHKQLSMSMLLNRLNVISSFIGNLYILNKSSYTIQDSNIVIAGCTLWSDMEPDFVIPPHLLRMNGMTESMYRSMYEDNLKYVSDMIDECKATDKKLIMITHYPPVVNKKSYKDIYWSLYGTDLESKLDNFKGIHTWISGHTHKTHDMIHENGCHFISNQYGTDPNESVHSYSYNKECVVDIM